MTMICPMAIPAANARSSLRARLRPGIRARFGRPAALLRAAARARRRRLPSGGFRASRPIGPSPPAVVVAGAVRLTPAHAASIMGLTGAPWCAAAAGVA